MVFKYEEYLVLCCREVDVLEELKQLLLRYEYVYWSAELVSVNFVVHYKAREPSVDIVLIPDAELFQRILTLIVILLLFFDWVSNSRLWKSICLERLQV